MLFYLLPFKWHSQQNTHFRMIFFLFNAELLTVVVVFFLFYVLRNQQLKQKAKLEIDEIEESMRTRFIENNTKTNSKQNK